MTVTWNTNSTDNNWWNPANWTDTYGGQWINGVYVSHYVPEDVGNQPVLISGSQSAPTKVDYDASVSKEASNQLNNLEIGSYATVSVHGVQTTGDYAFNVNNLTVDANGELDIDTTSSVLLGSNPNINGTLKISNAQAVINSHSVSGSGTLILDHSILGSTSAYMQMGSNLTTKLENNSALYINNAVAGKAIEVDNSKNYIILQDYNQTVNTQIIGYNDNTVIRIESGGQTPISASWTYNNNGTYTIFIAFDQWGNGIKFTDVVLDKDPPFTIGTFKIVQNADGSWDITDPAGTDTSGKSTPTSFGGSTDDSCFLAGCMLQTVSGLKAVEDVQIGDEIITFDHQNSTDVIQPVVWVGKTHARALPDLSDDMAGYPVRILKDAIADGLPVKDMLITPEHCLFLDGKFVPVRMLVNGVSIFYDKSIASYDYYHIETEKHSIITVDGVLTESYLDTGNRATFWQPGSVVSLRRTLRTWENDAAAPLDVSRTFVEPLFRQIEDRAIGNTAGTNVVSFSNDPELRLVTENGVTIRPAREHNGYVTFMIPGNVENLRIISRASRPSDVIGPFVDDRRYFGVAIDEITLFEGKQSISITSHKTDAELDGWLNATSENARWTNGNALLSLGKRQISSVAMLTLRIHAAGPYVMSDATASTRQQVA
ncbi:MAG: Hint domain-containing protein [Acetobacter sp.]|nr:Hint domain-containing protein [Acetobacter sp.]MCH4060398.1 Hint domain-containing protein [Acetobacter sp.]MCH4087338.1 Hint domain-containing protein [Acetobacter sp.]MCI1293857.1 Hint domain-containing protein [Acetobacter sp.]MCI1320549.1 Hint domain-containing protein [Acetobacter sp.]